MIYLLLSILSSTIIFIIFKLFSRFEVNRFQAIIVNYFTATTCGFLSYHGNTAIAAIPNQAWFVGALALGIVFITIFNLMAITTQKGGLSVAAVATKMSVAIPVIFGIILYNESTEVFKIIGILIAILAVYLTAMKKTTGMAISPKNLVYPALVFLGSGLIDTTLKYIENNLVSQADIPLFSATIFFFAALTGVLLIIVKVFSQKIAINYRNIIAGIALGIPNYYSIYFLIKALRHTNFDSSSIFPINNVGILIVSTLVGLIFFKEKLTQKNWIGLGLAIISIILISFTTQN
ncbi:EamA/RhaT family transporter [Aquimarina brevivitae]|uniref:EamA domain-containing protein n=1 Tax=Aquimarina brevivitae TaxID=323412 RepID=A0A4Q7P1U8_9FLAO|nr:EamA/RhaT family transporter [Aquimarina brevivitae]RZS92622.1 hypothetical protein EV197_2760 [Aquimarina brevivitae]